MLPLAHFGLRSRSQKCALGSLCVFLLSRPPPFFSCIPLPLSFLFLSFPFFLSGAIRYGGRFVVQGKSMILSLHPLINDASDDTYNK